MTDVVVDHVGGLSEGERLIDTFVAPSKTFADIRRKATWWLPYVLSVLVFLTSGFMVGKKVGFENVAQQQMMKNPKQAEAMAQLTPEERAHRVALGAKFTQGMTYATPVLALVMSLVCALGLWLTTNFALGAQISFAQMLAIWMYAQLPRVLLGVLNIILLAAGVNTENYDVSNPVGTNVGFYLHDAPKWLQTAGSFLDVLSLWSIFLLILGIAIVAGKTKGQAAAVVLGWWFFFLVLFTGAAAAFS